MSRLAPVHVLSNWAVAASESGLLRAHRVRRGGGLWECSAQPSPASWPCSLALLLLATSSSVATETSPCFPPTLGSVLFPACPAFLHCQTLLHLLYIGQDGQTIALGTKHPQIPSWAGCSSAPGRLHSGTEVDRAASTQYGLTLPPSRGAGRWQRGTEYHFPSHLLGQRISPHIS